MRCLECGANIVPGAAQCKVCGADVVSVLEQHCGGDKARKWRSMVALVVLFIAFAGVGFGGSLVIKEMLPGAQEDTETTADNEDFEDTEDQTNSDGYDSIDAGYYEGEILSVDTPVKVRRSPDLNKSSVMKPGEVSSEYYSCLDTYNAANFGIAVVSEGVQVTVYETFTDVIDGKEYIWVNTNLGWMCAKEGNKTYLS